MKTLNEILSESLNEKTNLYGLSQSDMIYSWMVGFGIKNYTINEDMTIDVNGNVNLHKRNLKEFPDYIKFNIVTGFFDCSENKLKSLKGVPKTVGRSFDCDKNNIETLEYAPEKVDGFFSCRYNPGNFTEEDVKKVCKVKGNIYC